MLALAASANLWLKTWTAAGIPADIGIRVALALASLFAWAVAVNERSRSAWLVLFGVGLILVVLSWASLFHNLIFRRKPVEPLSTYEPRITAGSVPLFASGRFLLWEGDRTRFERVLDRLMSGRRGDFWFIQVPVRIEVRDTSLKIFAFTSWFDASERFLGIALENKAGMWTILGTFDSLGEPEYGELLLGWKSIDAIRLRFRNEKGRRRTVVLTTDSEVRLRWFYERLMESVPSRDFAAFLRASSSVSS